LKLIPEAGIISKLGLFLSGFPTKKNFTTEPISMFVPG